MSLAKLQNEFQSYLLNGEQTPFINSIETTPNGPTPSRRMEVYYEAYRLRLVDALMVEYPKILAMMGEDGFRYMARLYLDAHPSQHFSIRYFGQYLPEFLTKCEITEAKPELSEMAKFEWYLGLTLDGVDDTIASVETLMAIPPESFPNMSFRLHPVVQHMKTRFNTQSRFQAISEGTESKVEQLELHWLIWRQDLSARYASIPNEAYTLFKAIQEQQNFATCCETLMSCMDEQAIPGFALGYIQKWLNDGLFTQIDY